MHDDVEMESALHVVFYNPGICKQKPDDALCKSFVLVILCLILSESCNMGGMHKEACSSSLAGKHPLPCCVDLASMQNTVSVGEKGEMQTGLFLVSLLFDKFSKICEGSVSTLRNLHCSEIPNLL